MSLNILFFLDVTPKKIIREIREVLTTDLDTLFREESGDTFLYFISIL